MAGGAACGVQEARIKARMSQIVFFMVISFQGAAMG
jgi:hypothetical protein